MAEREADPFNPDELVAADEQAAKDVETESDELRSQIERVQQAFVRVFKAGTPSEDDRAIVMHNLEVFTRGERTPWHENERIHCVLTGRHEVYQRIRAYTTFGLDQLVLDTVANLNRQTKG